MSSICPPELFHQAITVMDSLIQHPISAIFLKPNPPDSYGDRLPMNPIGFLKIRQRLRERYYSTLYSWLTDVELVIHNVELSAGAVSFEAVMANEVRRRFNKERLRVCPNSLDSWLISVHKLGRIVTQLGALAPLRSAQIHEASSIVALPPGRQVSASGHEIQSLLNSLSLLTRPKERQSLGHVIRSDDEPLVLSDALLGKAKEHIAMTLSKRGLSFPE
jgi:hypothetical protein